MRFHGAETSQGQSQTWTSLSIGAIGADGLGTGSTKAL